MQEWPVSTIPVYDMQVAVSRKYGTVHTGTTWFGKCAKDKTIHRFQPEQANYSILLTFTLEAVREQREKHWDGGEEDVLDPLPEIDN